MRSQLLKFNQGLLLFVLLTVVMFYGKPILIPIVFAAMLAMLMAPLCRALDKKGLSRAISCMICVFILLVIMLLFIGIILAQVSVILQDLPKFEDKINELLTVMKNYVQDRFSIPIEKQTAILQNETRNLGSSIRQYSAQMLTGSVKLMAGMAITLAFTYLMLFHKEKYYEFFLNINKNGSVEENEGILKNISKVAQRYLTGRAISIFVLFVLYVIALWIIGIEGALLLAAIGALVNIIPYIGPLLAGVFPFIIAMVTKDSIQPAIWVVIIFSLIQGVDNYFVTPYVLGGEVSLSALATIVFIICGGFVWGVAGMILFIPMLSIVKIIFDAVPALQPYGNLIGDTGNRPTASFSQRLGNIFRKRTRNRG